MEIAKLFGLPAHPLFVHVPVVLIPLVGLGAVAMAVSARAREKIGWIVLGLAIVAGLSTQLAIGSGQALQDSVTRTAALREHISIAESIRPLALVLFLFALAVMLLDRRHLARWPFRSERSAEAPGALRVALAVLTVLAAVGANVRLWQIGDSGARATWSRTKIQSEQGHDEGSPPLPPASPATPLR